MRRVHCYMVLCAYLCLLLLAVPWAKQRVSVGKTNAAAVSLRYLPEHVMSQEGLLRLDLASPSLIQSLRDQRVNAQGSKFVQVDVVRVVNPKLYPVTVRVDYAPLAGAA